MAVTEATLIGEAAGDGPRGLIGFMVWQASRKKRGRGGHDLGDLVGGNVWERRWSVLAEPAGCSKQRAPSRFSGRIPDCRSGRRGRGGRRGRVLLGVGRWAARF
jgi:hypothetical protein